MSARTVPVDSIEVGERDRTDLGDVVELATSIAAVGLLHPVVVTDALTLVAGDRRLAAVRHLGWTEVPVTVVDLATAADVLRAEADENTCRKPLSPYEASRARERRARVLADDAAKRVGGRPRKDTETSAKLAEVSPLRADRETRKAGAAGTGYSGSTLDKVDKIRIAAERGVVRQDRTEVEAPPEVVEVAKRELEGVKQTGAAVDRASKALDQAINRYVDAGPDVQRAKYLHEFMRAMGRSDDFMEFDPETLAELADTDVADSIARYPARVADFVDRFRKARSGLRLISGGGQ